MSNTNSDPPIVAHTASKESWTPEERHARIAEAAYLRAAARGFAAGDHIRDWLEAEMELMESAQRADQ